MNESDVKIVKYFLNLIKRKSNIPSNSFLWAKEKILADLNRLIDECFAGRISGAVIERLIEAMKSFEDKQKPKRDRPRPQEPACNDRVVKEDAGNENSSGSVPRRVQRRNKMASTE
ncbi:MAG: hypothetical protein QXD44_08345 [Candidatus Nezhaarchaeales archaeon]